MNDLFQNNITIKRQRQKLRSTMKDLTVELGTNSKYHSLSREDKRIAEYHNDMMVSEISLQKDMRGVEKVACRIAQILDKLHKDVTRIKQLLGNYTFSNTVGMDSSASGDCSVDLSTDIGTREMWKQELSNMISNVYHYVEAQNLGDYALLHSVSTSSNCCPIKYRSEFHYSAPRGDCMSLASSIGPAYTAMSDLPSGGGDIKNIPTVYAHHSVKNPDLDFAHSYKLYVVGDTNEWLDKMNLDYRYAVESLAAGPITRDYRLDTGTYISDIARKELIKTYLVNELNYSPEEIDAFLILADQTEYIITGDMYTDIDTTVIDEIVQSFSTGIAKIEDESDLYDINEHFVDKLNTIRKYQQQNDLAQQHIKILLETSKCNASFHKDAFQELTDIDMSVVRSKRSVGMQLNENLNKLYKENCFTKQNMFNDITLSGGEW